MTHPLPPAESPEPGTFAHIFFPAGRAMRLSVPDYQRAYSWEEKQTALFIGDLAKYHALPGKYYFGHFIVEQAPDSPDHWEIVDGQQRLTTFILFLMVCRTLHPAADSPGTPARALLDRFSTVSYDRPALHAIAAQLPAYLAARDAAEGKNPPPSKLTAADIAGAFALDPATPVTRSQRRLVQALLHFHHAFGEKGPLRRELIPDYISVIMGATSSHHLARNKSVAVNIFEMHNTRGLPLSTIEIVKAKLMKFVHDHGGPHHARHLAAIQEEFGHIFALEETLAEHSFRGDMTLDQLLRLHLRVIGDGRKTTADSFRSPAMGASAADLITYVEDQLHAALATGTGTETGTAEDTTTAHDHPIPAGARYALGLATEFRRSMEIMTRTLPAWDLQDPLVGDVIILEREYSCEFFLLACRRLTPAPGHDHCHLTTGTLRLWEKLLFTRDFHGHHYHLKGLREDFPALFAAIGPDEAALADTLRRYLAEGFVSDRTPDLQAIVLAHLAEHEDTVLDQAFNWWKHKMIYTIYKYETHRNARLRNIMKGTISVEHLLPQNWASFRSGRDPVLKAMPEEEWTTFRKTIETCINGIGNLLLLTPGENASASDHHPADKTYERYATGGTYEEHHHTRGEWESCHEWETLIRTRGQDIYRFLRHDFLGAPDTPTDTPAPQDS